MEEPYTFRQKEKTTVSEIPARKGNKDLEIVIKDLEKLQPRGIRQIGPKTPKIL